MKILSKFEDYYDATMKVAMDNNVLYFRDQQQYKLYNKYSLGDAFKSGQEKYRLHILGYCGQIILIYELISTTASIFYYDFDIFKKDAIDSGKLTDKDFRNTLLKKNVFDKFREQDLSEVKSCFNTYEVPLFLISNYHYGQILLTNPRLYSICFDIIKNSYNSYYDIYDFIKITFNENKKDTLIFC